MPPRICSSRLSPVWPVHPSFSFPLCSQCLHRSRQRQFSSNHQHATRQREVFFRWLAGPGAAFKQPLPGSTNYLNAYDSGGGLIRIKGAEAPSRQEDQEDKEDKEVRAKSDKQQEGDEEGGDRVREVATPRTPKAVEALQKTASDTDKRSPGVRLPQETSEDLMPFPMNRQFRSQPVLSEQLKDEIYKRVVEQEKSVRDVSAVLNVEMRRVGAVVRLKALEKDWEKQVSFLITSRNCFLRLMAY